MIFKLVFFRPLAGNVWSSVYFSDHYCTEIACPFLFSYICTQSRHIIFVSSISGWFLFQTSIFGDAEHEILTRFFSIKHLNWQRTVVHFRGWLHRVQFRELCVILGLVLSTPSHSDSSIFGDAEHDILTRIFLSTSAGNVWSSIFGDNLIEINFVNFALSQAGSWVSLLFPTGSLPFEITLCNLRWWQGLQDISVKGCWSYFFQAFIFGDAVTRFNCIQRAFFQCLGRPFSGMTSTSLSTLRVLVDSSYAHFCRRKTR